MSAMATAEFNQDKSRFVATRRMEDQGGNTPHRVLSAFTARVMRGNPPSPRIVDAFATARDKSVKPIVSESFTKPLNNQTHAANAAKIDQLHQSSAQVS
jgi:hypothetical protein